MERIEALNLRETYLNYLENYLKTNIAADSIVAPSSFGISEPILNTAVGQINTLIVQRNRFVPSNPYYKRYTEDIELAKRMIDEALRTMRDVMRIEKRDLNEKLAEAQRQLVTMPEKELEMKTLDRKYRMDDNYYTYFLQKRAEAAIQKASNTSDNEILDRAQSSGAINEGVKQKNISNWLVIGLLFPLAFVIIKELTNSTIRTSDELEKLTWFPNIGSIRTSKQTDPVLATKHPRSSFTEMFRIIRTRIEFIVQRKNHVVVLITSAESGDGKTYFATNMSSVYAMTKRKTLLVDMDVRKPSVLKQFNCEKQHIGVTDYLVGDCTLEETIVHIEGLEFDILPAGTVPPNPGELVRSEKLKQMIDILREQYDYIILDTSPVGLVADAYSIMGYSDVNLFIVRQNKTNKSFVKRILTQLKADKITKIYSVLNDTNPRGSGYYAGKYGKYGEYGAYGGGYYGYLSRSKRREINQRKKYYADEEEV